MVGLGSDRWRNRKPRNKKKKRRKKKRIAARRSVFSRVHWIDSVQAFAVLEKSFARSHRLQNPARNVRMISVEMEEEGNSISQTVFERCFKKISYIHPLVSGQVLTLPFSITANSKFQVDFLEIADMVNTVRLNCDGMRTHCPRFTSQRTGEETPYGCAWQHGAFVGEGQKISGWNCRREGLASWMNWKCLYLVDLGVWLNVEDVFCSWYLMKGQVHGEGWKISLWGVMSYFGSYLR